MLNRTIAALLVTSMLGLPFASGPALADNKMDYSLLTSDQAAALPKNGGVLGMEVGRAQQITSGGMTFDLLRVNGVRASSAGAQAGFKVGDQIIAVDGRVFPSVAAFAAYVGSMAPAQQISVDYMPAGGGPQQAQRVSVTLGATGRLAPSQAPAQAPSAGLSTGTKIAIGAGAAALFGCYKLGCFSHLHKPSGIQQQPAGTAQ